MSEQSAMKKVVILFSGEGHNMEAIIKKLHKKVQEGAKNCHGIAIVAAVTNNPDAGGIKRAQTLDVPVAVLDHKAFESRESFDRELISCVKSYHPDLVVMAGFMRIVGPQFTQTFRAVNIHPSLLPRHKGAKAIEQSFQSGDRVCGVSVHHVTEELDSGAIILQESFERSGEDTLESFTAKIKSIEHEIYAKAIKKLLCD